jgi:hypothetical protein
MAKGKKEIYYANGKGIVVPDDIWEQAMIIAARTHPAWHRCSQYAKKLHARNGFQILGADLTIRNSVPSSKDFFEKVPFMPVSS